MDIVDPRDEQAKKVMAAEPPPYLGIIPHIIGWGAFFILYLLGNIHTSGMTDTVFNSLFVFWFSRMLLRELPKYRKRRRIHALRRAKRVVEVPPEIISLLREEITTTVANLDPKDGPMVEIEVTDQQCQQLLQNNYYEAKSLLGEPLQDYLNPENSEEDRQLVENHLRSQLRRIVEEHINEQRVIQQLRRERLEITYGTEPEEQL